MTAATMVLLVGCLLLAVGMAQRNDSESSYLWTIIGVGLLPGWVRFAVAFTPGKRKRNKRLKALSKQQREKCGWLNNQWLVEYDDHSAIRGSWSMVSNAMIFPTHLLLPQVVDNSRRIVLPWRFFASYQEIRQTIDILHAKVGVLVNRPPLEDEFEASVDRESLSEIDVAAPITWDAIHWPFPSTREDETSFVLDLTRGRSPALTALRFTLTIALVLAWIFLPVLIGLFLWLTTQYQQFGGWSFIYDQPAIAAIGLVPSVLLVAFAVYRSFIGARAAVKFQATPLQLCLRPEGLHLSKESVDSWSQWTAIRQVIAEPKYAGWISAESGEKLRFPVACFSSPEDFERLKSALLRLGPAPTS